MPNRTTRATIIPGVVFTVAMIASATAAIFVLGSGCAGDDDTDESDSATPADVAVDTFIRPDLGDAADTSVPDVPVDTFDGEPDDAASDGDAADGEDASGDASDASDATDAPTDG